MREETLGHQALKQAQERCDFNNRQLAYRIGVHQSSITRWFNQNLVPRPKARIAIRKAFGIEENLWLKPVKPEKEIVQIDPESVQVKSENNHRECVDCPFDDICKAHFSDIPTVLKMITGRNCLAEPIVFALPVRTSWVQCKPGEIKKGDIVRRKERPDIELTVKDVFSNTEKFRDLMIVSNAEVDEALVKCENFEVQRTNGVI